MSFKKRKSSLVQLARNYRVPEGLTLRIVGEILQSLDCPRALSVWIIINNDASALKTLDVRPENYFSAYEFRDAYLATKLVWKANFLEVGRSPKEEALAKFYEMEQRCKRTNNRFRHLELDPNYQGPNVWMYNAFIRKVSSVLVGYNPEELFNEANWGPGVSTLIKGEDATATNKFQRESGITRDLYYLVENLLIEGYPLWGNHLKQLFAQNGTLEGAPHFEVGNQVVTVPKDAFIDRVIAVEPGINLWFQKAIGSMIRKRLLVHGIDLNNQGINQRAAYSSSKTGELATVDFSSASDTISKELIREVLPSHWFALMDRCRSHFGLVDDKPLLWEKFSSMGNGFTFELESLIFFCAAHVSCEYLKLDTKKISVYGDDVLLPVGAIDTFSSFCDFLGFEVNQKKSFSSGPFRESCGSHFYDGIDVKPAYIKNACSNVFELYRLANSIRELAHRRGGNLFCDAVLKKSWLSVFLSVPKALRIFGPLGKGDGFFVGNFDEAAPFKVRDTITWEGYYFYQFVHVGVPRNSEEIGLLLDRLKNPSIQEYGNTYTLRGRTRVSFTRTLVAQWYNLGKWY